MSAVRGRHWVFGLAFVLLLASLACAGCQLSGRDPELARSSSLGGAKPASSASSAGSATPKVPSRKQAPRPESDLVVSLLKLADDALASGKPDLAESRYRRALSLSPGSNLARVGLVSVLISSQREEEASLLLGELLETSAGVERVDALILLAELDIRRGRRSEAKQALSEAVALDDDRYGAHHQLALLTGLAPRTPVQDDDEALLRASLHPYDPAALLAGARVRVARGDIEGATLWLEDTVWLADVDRESSRHAIALLGEIDKKWSRRGVVKVHVYADESVRHDPAWRARIRAVWRSTSMSLDSILRVAFVPVSMQSFQSARSGADLASINQAFEQSTSRLPSRGLVAVLTDRAPPRRRGSHQLGLAELMGRRLSVRLNPGEIVSRTLLHEVLHIYGAVHVTPNIESLMNPGGVSIQLDPANQMISWLMRDRRFGPGGVNANVLPYVDTDDLIRGYLEILRVNLKVRRRDSAVARDQQSRYLAAELGRQAAKLDPHLADVARVTAGLMKETGRLEDASSYYMLAARLYDPQSQRAQEMRERALFLRDAANRQRE